MTTSVQLQQNGLQWSYNNSSILVANAVNSPLNITSTYGVNIIGTLNASSTINTSGGINASGGVNIGGTINAGSLVSSGCIFGNNNTTLITVTGFGNGQRGTGYTWGGTFPPINADSNGDYATYYSYVGNGSIMTKTGAVDVFSDKRTKKNIVELSSLDSLNIIRKCKPVKYNYIDKESIDNYGFIAQDIKNILPSSITKVKDFIPNIFEIVEVISDKVIRLNKKTKQDFTIQDIIKLKFYIITENSNKEVIITLKEFIDDKTFTINECFDCDLTVDNIFLYGQEVNDLHVLNYSQTNIINISAVKQLDEELQEAKKTLEENKLRIERQKNEIQQLHDELNNLKQFIYSKLI